MENSQKKTQNCRKKRQLRVRKHLRGNEEKPRLCVVRSGAHVYVQLIDDEKGFTLASASTLSGKKKDHKKRDKESAKKVGETIAKQALAKNINKAVFDRGACKYHGIIAAVADGAREGGLEV